MRTRVDVGHDTEVRSDQQALALGMSNLCLLSATRSPGRGSRASVIDFGICQIVGDEMILTTTDRAFGNATLAAPECFPPAASHA